MTKYKITDEMLTNAVRDSVSFSEALRTLNLATQGGAFTHYRNRAVALGLDFSHFGHHSIRRGDGRTTPKRNASEILVLREVGVRQQAKNLRRALIEVGRPYCCDKCSQPPEWMGNPMTLDVDHINENWLDDRAENLRFLCPNCHSQFSRGLINAKSKAKPLWRTSAPLKVKPCLKCGEQVKTPANNYCSQTCEGYARQTQSWEDIDLVALVEVEKIPYLQLGKRFSVSGRTIKKWYLKQKALQSNVSQV